MAQKPSFLKRITTASTVAFAAAAIVGSASSAAAVDLITTGSPADYNLGTNIRSAAGVPPIIPGAGDYLFLGGLHNVSINTGVATTINLYGYTGKTITVGANNATLTALLNDVSAAAVARAGAANGGNVGAGPSATPTATLAFAAGGPYNFNFVLNDVTQLAGVDFNNNGGTLTFTGASDGLNFTKTIKSTGGASGGIIVDVNNLTISGAFDGANKIDTLIVNDTKTVTLDTALILDAGVTLQGNAGTAGGTLVINDGKDITVTDISGQNADAGTLTFQGASTVVSEIGNNNALHVINIGNGIVDFQGAAGGADLKSTTINLTDANAAMKLSTQAQAVVGNVVNTIADGNGSIIVDGAFAHSIKGTIGATGKSLAAINFNVDNQLTITAPNANPTDFYVQNVTTTLAKAANGNGSLILDGNYNIYSNIGTVANPLKLVSIVNVANAGATTTTLKAGNTINATDFQLTGGPNNILQLDTDTVVNANITTANANNGIITLLGNSTINGDIGAGNAIDTINLKGFNLSFGGSEISTNNVNGITFLNDETLFITNIANATPLVLDTNITATVNNKGNIDATALKAGKVLNISANVGTAANTLGNLALGDGTVVLSGGDVFINNVTYTGPGALQIAHNNYRISQTTNQADSGIVNINPTAVANNLNTTTLVTGTNLGSATTPLQAINFGNVANGAADVVLSVGKDVNLYATKINATTANIGSFDFNGGGTSVVGGLVGSTNALNNVNLSNGTTVKFLNDAVFAGDTTIADTSVLQITGSYEANSITSNAANNGNVQFVNSGPINVKLAAVPAAALKTVTFSGSGNIALQGIAGSLGNTINFAGKSAGAIVTLVDKTPFDGLTINSTAGNPGSLAPVLISTNVDSIIAANQTIGNANNIIGLGLGSDNSVTVNSAVLYAGIAPTVNNNGTVILNGGSGAVTGKIYGLGIKANDQTYKLKTVTVATNTENLTNTYVTDLTVNDSITYTAGNTVDANIILGSKTGTGNAVFRDGTNLLSTSAITAQTAKNGTVVFQGGATVNNIGASGTPVASVAFNGADGSFATLTGSIYSQTINFKGYDLIVATPNAILSGNSAVNGEINLGTNALTFAGGASTWAADTAINTTLQNGTLGKIIINGGGTVTAAGNVLANVTINDQADLNTANGEYLLIDGGANLTLTNGNIISDIKNNRNGFIGYTISQVANKDYYLLRSNNAVAEVTSRLAGSKISGLLDAGLTLYNMNNTGNASTAANNFTLFADKNDFNQAVAAVGLVDNSVVKSTMNTTGAVADVIDNRVAKVRELGVPANSRDAMLAAPERGAPGVAVGAADDAEDNVSYGAWVQPFYKQENQKAKGGVAGYKAKTTGGLLGFDTMANDNLMIGAAVGITKTDMKHKDYKAGDKSTINGFLFSLYGAQQLVDNFFFQGAATFSTNQVKNKSKRYMSNPIGQKVQETANASYDNMTYAVEGMFGYDAKVMESLLVTPIAGVRYTKSSDESYKETGTLFQNKNVTSKFSDKTDLVFGARVIGEAMNLSQFTFYPEAHGFVTHKVAGKLAKIQSSLDGQVNPFVGQSDKSAKTSYNLGLSVTTRPGPQMEYGIGYDANLASKYVAHQGTLKVRVNF